MTRPRINLSGDQFVNDCAEAAKSDGEKNVSTWAQKILEQVLLSGLTLSEVRDALNHASEIKRQHFTSFKDVLQKHSKRGRGAS